MGKIEGIFATNISGKVGNVVFRKNGKQNIVSQRPASVKNPRSDMQQRQRAYIKTVSSAYSVLRPICDHSFEGVAYGADSMNFFKKENYKIVSNAGRAVLKNSSNVVVNSNLLLSKGSISWYLSLGSEAQIADISQYLSNNNITSIAVLKYSQLCDALNIKKGDQITVINVSREGMEFSFSEDTILQYGCNIYFSRYILEDNINETTKAFVKRGDGSEYYVLNAAILSNFSEIDAKAELIATERGCLKISKYKGNGPDMHSAIISRRSADGWLRSTATLYQENEEFPEFGIDKVLPSYYPTGERYLNNAEK